MAFVSKIILAGALGMSAVASFPTAALAHGDWGHRDYRYHDDDHDRHGHRAYRRGYDRSAEYRRYHYRDEPRYVDRSPREGCRTSGTTGLIVGAGVGALLGRAIDTHGDRAMGTILGAGGGALLGREVDSKHRC